MSDKKDIKGIHLYFGLHGFNANSRGQARIGGRIESECMVFEYEKGRFYRFILPVSQEAEDFFKEIRSIDAVVRCDFIAESKGRSNFSLQIDPYSCWEDVFPHLERIFEKYKDLIS